ILPHTGGPYFGDLFTMFADANGDRRADAIVFNTGSPNDCAVGHRLSILSFWIAQARAKWSGAADCPPPPRCVVVLSLDAKGLKRGDTHSGLRSDFFRGCGQLLD